MAKRKENKHAVALDSEQVDEIITIAAFCFCCFWCCCLVTVVFVVGDAVLGDDSEVGCCFCG